MRAEVAVMPKQRWQYRRLHPKSLHDPEATPDEVAARIEERLLRDDTMAYLIAQLEPWWTAWEQYHIGNTDTVPRSHAVPLHCPDCGTVDASGLHEETWVEDQEPYQDNERRTALRMVWDEERAYADHLHHCPYCGLELEP